MIYQSNKITLLIATVVCFQIPLYTEPVPPLPRRDSKLIFKSLRGILSLGF